MFYAICEGAPGSSGSAYVIYKFHTLESMKPCEAVNEYSIIYNGDSHRQLIDFCSLEELFEIATCLCGEVTFVSHQQAADYVHSVVVKKAKLWKPEEEPNMSTVHVDQFNNKTQKHEAEVKQDKKPRTRLNKEAKIKVLHDDPAFRTGSLRDRYIELIKSSSTVGEALEKLKDVSNPGSWVNFAIKSNIIAVEQE